MDRGSTTHLIHRQLLAALQHQLQQRALVLRLCCCAFGPQRVRDRTTASGTEVRTKAGWPDIGGDVLSSRNPAEVSRFDEDGQARGHAALLATERAVAPIGLGQDALEPKL